MAGACNHIALWRLDYFDVFTTGRGKMRLPVIVLPELGVKLSSACQSHIHHRGHIARLHIIVIPTSGFYLRPSGARRFDLASDAAVGPRGDCCYAHFCIGLDGYQIVPPDRGRRCPIIAPLSLCQCRHLIGRRAIQPMIPAAGMPGESRQRQKAESEKSRASHPPTADQKNDQQDR